MSDEIDPRYDPRFQRGFDGPLPVTAPRAEPTVPDRIPERPLQLDPDPTGVARSEPVARVEIDAGPALVERPLTANPVIWGLLVVGAALVVAGIVLFTGWTSLARQTGDEPVDYALLQFLIQVTPILLGLGGATLLGVGFLFAIDRQRRTRMPADEPRRL